jgi:hypothetical protein
MPKSLTASDRSALIKLASSLEKGSDERKAILAGLAKTSGVRPREMTQSDLGSGFGGSRPFGDGGNPWLASVRKPRLTAEDIYYWLEEEDEPSGDVASADVVADANGIGIYLQLEDGGDINVYSAVRDTDSAWAEEAVGNVARGLERGRLPEGRWELL